MSNKNILSNLNTRYTYSQEQRDKLSIAHRKFNITRETLIEELKHSTQTEIAKKYNVGQGAVSRSLNRLGIYQCKRKKYNKLNLSRDELIEELKHLTQVQIAKKYDIDQTTVSIAKVRYNITNDEIGRKI